MIDTPGDLVWDLLCMQHASYMYLEGGPLMWVLPLYLQGNKKSGGDDNKAKTNYICGSYYMLLRIRVGR